MSLINEMLRDLEARRAGDLSKPDLQREIRPLPGGNRSNSYGVAILVIFLALLAVGGMVAWWHLGFARETLAFQAPLTESKSESPVPAPGPAVPVIRSQDPAADAVVEALRLAMTLENPPIEAAPVKEMPAVQQQSPVAVATPKPEITPVLPSKGESPVAQPRSAGGAPTPAGSVEKSLALATPRERADAEFRRAQSLSAAGGQPASIAEILHGALKQDPGYSTARQFLVKLLLESRRVDEAVAVLQDGLEIQPAQIGWALSLARLLVERGDVAGAERTLARSRGYGAGSPDYVGFHGHLLNRLGKFGEAAELYQLATRMVPGDGRWWFGLGQALEGGGRGDEARSAFRRALEAGNLNPDLAALAEQKLR